MVNLRGKNKIFFAAWSCHNKNYFAYQTWDAPLRKLFSEVITFDPQEYTYRNGKEKMNKEFLKIIQKEKPEYVFLWLIYDEFYPETLFSIKRLSPKTKVINFCGDDDAQFQDYSALNSFFVDYSLISHKEFVKLYKNKAFFSVGTNTAQFKPLKIGKKYDLTFIGTPKADRVEFISYLMNKGIKIKVFGAGWEKYSNLKKIWGGFLDKEDYVKVINQSKINLCFSKNYLGKTHIIQKFFEINACRAFMLTEYCKGYLDLFELKNELVMFKNPNELYKKAIYYLKNEKERELIAERAYKRLIENYSSDIELKNIFNEIYDYGENVPQKKLPKINGKVKYLSANELKKPANELRNLLNDFSYVSFNLTGKSLPYKELFQITALEMFNKEISCCDSYIYSKILGDYAVLYNNLAFNKLNHRDFSKIIRLDNLIVKKNFFLNNLEKFKEYSEGKPIDLVNKKNTAFVTRPFVRLKEPPKLSYDLIKKVIWTKYEDKLKPYVYQRDPRLFVYFCLVFLNYLLGNKLLLKHIKENATDKIKRTKFIAFLQKLF